MTNKYQKSYHFKEVLKYIEAQGNVSIYELNTFLREKLDIESNTTRSKFIKRLIDAEFIQRHGSKGAALSYFTLVTKTVTGNLKHDTW